VQQLATPQDVDTVLERPLAIVFKHSTV